MNLGKRKIKVKTNAMQNPSRSRQGIAVAESGLKHSKKFLGIFNHERSKTYLDIMDLWRHNIILEGISAARVEKSSGT